jgi:D-alanine-D-alanine ligase
VTKLRIGVIYGGRSGEHEVSIASAASVCAHLDPGRYQVVPIRIDKDGRWALAARTPAAASAADVIAAGPTRPLETTGADATAEDPDTLALVEPAATLAGIDVVFPVLHGPYGEDGTVQGLLELLNVAYVGAGVLGSAVGMDKAVMKTLFAAHGLPVAPWLVVRRHEWDRGPDALAARVAETLRYPVFVKPANLGSSVGISKVASPAAIGEAITMALQFDRKVVVEAAVPQAREIECAVLGNDEPEASVPGEVVPAGEFYDYRAKYIDAGSQLLIPAPLGETQAAEVRRLAIAAFHAVEGAGMARVDFLLAGATNDLVVNEVNTIPGFTTISMYPKMWEASGLPYAQLLDRLIALARERHAAKQRLRSSLT